MSYYRRQSGFREDLTESPPGTISSQNYPPSYQQYPDITSPISAAVSQEEEEGYHTSIWRSVSPPQRNFSHRLSDKQAQPAELSSPGLESVWTGEGDKEVYLPEPVITDEHTEHVQSREGEHFEAANKQKRRLYGVYLIIALIIIVGLVLGLGLGLGLRKEHRIKSQQGTPGSSDYLIGGALDPKYYSYEGAWNGSGIAVASQSFEGNSYGSLVMYFQHHTGQIRYKQQTQSGWVGGTVSEVVAADAKNSTPLSAVAYAINQTSTWHIFYIDKNNILRQKSNSNVTNLWVDGPLSSQNLKVLDADQIGMQSCWYGSDYGDSDYRHTPLPSNGNITNSTGSGNDVGMHLWYAVDNSTFSQLGWRQGDLTWTQQQTWNNKNGHAGVACYSWGPGTTTYVMFVNQSNAVEVWWKDTNTNLTSTDAHPINEWTETSVSIPDVHPSTSLGYTNVLYAQTPAGRFQGYNISWNAENTTFTGPTGSGSNLSPALANSAPGGDTLTVSTQVDDVGIPGSHMSNTALPTSSGGNDLVVFYQVNGSDIMQFQRDIVSGAWTGFGISIPDA